MNLKLKGTVRKTIRYETDLTLSLRLEDANLDFYP